jgi:hypothetical protein
MKKALTFLLVILYTLSSVGASVSTHYCMGKVMKCQCAKPKNKNQTDHCCKDTVKFVKTQDVHANQIASELKKQVTVAYVNLHQELVLGQTSLVVPHCIEKHYICNWNAPPIYKLIGNYRI